MSELLAQQGKIFNFGSNFNAKSTENRTIMADNQLLLFRIYTNLVLHSGSKSSRLPLQLFETRDSHKRLSKVGDLCCW